MLIAQSDDPIFFAWITNAAQRGGGFVSTIAMAALMADHENYSLMRGLLIELREKYPAYEPSDDEKREILEALTR